MITYVYECHNKTCDKYGEEQEIKQKIWEDPVERCPVCNSIEFTRVIQPTQVLLKGEGWPSNENKGIVHVTGKEKGMGDKK